MTAHHRPATSARSQRRAVPIYRSRADRPKPVRQTKTSYRPPRELRSRPIGFWGRVVQITVAIVVLLLALLVAVIAWTVHQSGFVNSQNILFVKDEKDSSEAKIVFAFLSGKTQETIIANIDPSTPVPVIGGYGEYQLKAVRPLLKLDKKSSTFVNAAYSWGVGRVVDDVVALPADYPLSLTADQTTVGSFLRQLLVHQPLLNKDWLRVAQMYIFAANTHQLEKPIATLSVPQLNDIPSTFDQAPGCSLAVINTTPATGLATKMSTLLESSNVRVIRVSDSNFSQPETTLFTKQDQSGCNEVFTHLTGLWPWEVAIKVDEKMVNQYRADGVIVLGNDFPHLFDNWPIGR